MIYLELLLGFLRVGCFSFGGAYAAIPLIRDVVLSYGWLSDEMVTDMIAVSESTPGPIMVNMATYVGSTQAGVSGAAVATLAVVLPSFIVILLVMALLAVIFVGWILPKRVVRDEFTNGGSVNGRVFPVVYFLIKWVAPIAVVIIFFTNFIL